MSLIDRLTVEEKDKIAKYIDENLGGKRTASVEKILTEWDYCKTNSSLAKMFKDSFILEREICYTETQLDIEKKLNKERCVHMLCDAIYNAMKEAVEYFWDRHKIGLFAGAQMLSIGRLDKSYIEDYGNTLELKSVTKPPLKLRLQKGEKVIRILSKIVDYYDVDKDLFEQVRLAQSMAMNTKTLKGTMCLSIHPLDYMTMSDNNCDWNSCMSWQENGEYRQGTVEMMNSPMVIVAYITADDKVLKISSNQEWNSKKWRELFIVTPDIICNILGYPYRNANISQAAISLIKELAEENLGWSYKNKLPVIWEQYNLFAPFEENEEFEIEIRTETGWMYNDFSDREHFGFFGKNIDDGVMNIYYSGPAECMLCGMENPDLEEESCLAGECCEEVRYCDCCGERIYGDDMYYIDDMCLCSYCADDRVRTDSIYQEDHFDENMIEVVLLNEDDEKTYSSVYIYKDDFDWETLKKYFNKLIAYRPYKYGGNNWCVRIEDITPEGQKLFCDECGYQTFEEVILSCKRYSLAHLPSDYLKEYSHDRELVRW
jgi:hypothetical protein